MMWPDDFHQQALNSEWSNGSFPMSTLPRKTVGEQKLKVTMAVGMCSLEENMSFHKRWLGRWVSFSFGEPHLVI